jgi:hypothetical protein
MKRKLENIRNHFITLTEDGISYEGILKDIETLNRMITLLNFLIADDYEVILDEDADYDEYMTLMKDNLRKFWI